MAIDTPTPETRVVSSLVINNIESQEVYNYMMKNGLINDDELYLVNDDADGQVVEYVPVTGGTMTGELVAANDADYTTYKVRNVAMLTSVPTSMENGTIACVCS